MLKINCQCPTSAAGFPPFDSHLSSTCLPSTVLYMSPSGRILGGNGGARTVREAYLERMGSIPSEAPTWHWNLASSSSSTGLMSSVKSPGRGNSVVQKCANYYYCNWWKKTSCNCSSLNRNIWHSFCSFFYSWVYCY